MEKTKLVRTFGTALATATLSFGLFVPTALATDATVTGKVEIADEVNADGVAEAGENVYVTIPATIGEIDDINVGSSMTFKVSDGTVDQEYVLYYRTPANNSVDKDAEDVTPGEFNFSYKSKGNGQFVIDKIVANIPVSAGFINGTWKLDEIKLINVAGDEIVTIDNVDASFKVVDNDDHQAPASVDLENIFVKKEVHHRNRNMFVAYLDGGVPRGALTEVVYVNPAGVEQNYNTDDRTATVTGGQIMVMNLDTEVDGYYSLKSITIKVPCESGTANLFDAITYDDMAILSDGDYTVSELGVEAMLRVYNPYTGEHLYTNDPLEAAAAVAAGWKDEGLAWYAPVSGYYPGSLAPVYRVYNQYNGEHHYTTSAEEVLTLVAAGWTDEGIGFYTTNKGDAQSQAVYRLFNPFATVGTHHYTLGAEERDAMIDAGWKDEGVGWYGVRVRDLD